MGPPVHHQREAILAAITDVAVVIAPGSTVDLDAAQLVVPPSTETRAIVSLDALVDECDAVDHPQWPNLIAAWLSSVLDGLGGPTRPLALDDLRVRLVPTPEIPVERSITRPYGPQFQMQLMADLPDRRVWVTDTEALGMPESEAFTAGLRNTITKVLVGLDVREHTLPDGTVVAFAAADGVPWISTGLTSIPQLFRAPQLAYGALVAAPRLSAIIFHEVRSAGVLDVAVVLSRLVGDMYRGANDPCSPDLWWFHEGSLHHADVDGNQVRLDESMRLLVDSLPSADP